MPPVGYVDDANLDFTRLMALAGGHAEARAIQAALKLGFFEALAATPRDAGGLAEATNCDRRATMLLANALTALGLLHKEGESFSLTAVASRLLLQGSSHYLGGMILFEESLWTTWGKLDEVVRCGRPARVPDMYQSDPVETDRFIRAMDSLVRARGDAIWTARFLDLSNARTIGDVGGGPGTYLLEFLNQWPGLRGILFDLPATLQITRQILDQRGGTARERLTLRELDYKRADIPGPLDVIFMSNIIHSEDEDTNASLMANCFRALEQGGLLVIKDHVMDTSLTVPAAGAVFSLYLLLTTNGRDYSFDEISQWLHAAGFVDLRLEALPSPPFTSSLVLARKPPTR
jgi:SAM-dependent methyltransferase